MDNQEEMVCKCCDAYLSDYDMVYVNQFGEIKGCVYCLHEECPNDLQYEND